MQKPRLDCLTTLRFFAAAQVVVFHCGGKALEGSPWWVQGMFQNGYQAVIFFFVLSGFILTYSYCQEGNDSELRTSNKDFWIARMARIYPMYALALLISVVPYIYSTFVAHITPMPRFIGGILCVPLLLQAWIPKIAWEWNIPAWSLSVEAFFYALFPLVVRKLFRNTTPKAFIAMAGIFVLATGVFLLSVSQSGGNEAAVSETKYKFFAFCPVWHLPAFLFGMAFGRLFMIERSRILGDKIFVLVSSFLVAIFALHEKVSPIFLSAAVLTPLFGILIFSAANCGGIIQKLLSHSWLIFLGEVSYGIYILHIPLAFWCSRIWERALGHSPESNKAYFFIYFAAMLLFCCLTFVLFEVPARRALTGYLKTALKGKERSPV